MSAKTANRGWPEDGKGDSAVDRAAGWSLETLLLLANGFTHDINNALGAALGFVEIAREELPAETGADLDLALESLGRAIALIRQFRDLCRGPAAGGTGFSLAPLVKEMTKRLGDGRPGGGGPRVELPEAMLLVRGDPWALLRALSLLLAGAGPAGGGGWRLRLERKIAPEGGGARALFLLDGAGPSLDQPLAETELEMAWRGLGGGVAAQGPGRILAWLPLASD